jgi:predicted HAD superfamily Cof-like phosphohydrolase
MIESSTLYAPMTDIREFHEVFARTPHPTVPTMQTPFQANRRATWIEEEAQEVRDATDIASQADGYIDVIYFAMGGLDELGIDPSPLWDIVHQANMAKRQPDGSVSRDPVTFKTLKPEGWVAPEPLLRAEVQRQIDAASA